jgi:succinate dehydrogenase / fumarate reductase iron-sulfur subunit
VIPASDVPVVDGIRPSGEDEDILRLTDCIECGLCISACSVMSTDSSYLGPAALAAIQLRGLVIAPRLADLADSREGVWRCHSIYDCSAVCPSNVEPGWRIMDLRRQTVASRFRQLFQSRTEVSR